MWKRHKRTNIIRMCVLNHILSDLNLYKNVKSNKARDWDQIVLIVQYRIYNQSIDDIGDIRNLH